MGRETLQGPPSTVSCHSASNPGESVGGNQCHLGSPEGHPWPLSSRLCSLGCGTLPASHILDLVTLQGTSDQLVHCRASSGGGMSQLHSGNKALVLFAPPTWMEATGPLFAPLDLSLSSPGPRVVPHQDNVGCQQSPQSQRKATQAARKRVLAPHLHQSRAGCLPGFPSLTAT